MDEPSSAGLTRYLPHVAFATLLVAVLPVALVWVLIAAGVLHSTIVSVALSMVLAMGASYVGNLLWSTLPGSRDLLFSELMPWGWLRRLWVERRLSHALHVLGDEDAEAQLPSERRSMLLAQLATSLEARDPYTHGHSRRVARHAATIAKRMGLSRQEVDDVRAAAVVHDVGKMSTPNEVLRKPGALSNAEFAVIKEHSVRGAEIVSKLGNDELTAMVRHHHERLDGSGYPDGLAGSAIPLGARIIAVADTFDAITSTRPYRSPRTHRAAIAILHEQAGAQLDPDAVRAFQTHYSGQRPLAAWVAVTSLPERLLSWFLGGVNVATGSTARAVATSALTGAAAVTAVVDSHPALSSGRPHTRRAPVAAMIASSTAPAATFDSTFQVAARPAVASVLEAQPTPTAASIVLAPQHQAASSSPADAQVAGAAVSATTAGSPAGGTSQAAAGQIPGAELGGQGGQATGSRQVPGVPVADSTGAFGGGDAGITRAQGDGSGVSSQALAATQIEPAQISSDGQHTSTGTGQTPTAGVATPTTGPADTHTPASGGASTPASTGTTVPPATAGTSPPTQGAAGDQPAASNPAGSTGLTSTQAPAAGQTQSGNQAPTGSEPQASDANASAAASQSVS